MATTGVINGTKFGVYAGSTKIGFATSASLSINHNLRDTTTIFCAGISDRKSVV